MGLVSKEFHTPSGQARPGAADIQGPAANPATVPRDGCMDGSVEAILTKIGIDFQ